MSHLAASAVTSQECFVSADTFPSPRKPGAPQYRTELFVPVQVIPPIFFWLPPSQTTHLRLNNSHQVCGQCDQREEQRTSHDYPAACRGTIWSNNQLDRFVQPCLSLMIQEKKLVFSVKQKKTQKEKYTLT